MVLQQPITRTETITSIWEGSQCSCLSPSFFFVSLVYSRCNCFISIRSASTPSRKRPRAAHMSESETDGDDNEYQSIKPSAKPEILIDKEDIRFRRLMHYSKNDFSPAITIKKQPPSTSQKSNKTNDRRSTLASTLTPTSGYNTDMSQKARDQVDWSEDFEATVKLCVEQGMDEEEAMDFVIQSITGDTVQAAHQSEVDEWDDDDSEDEWAYHSAATDVVYQSSCSNNQRPVDSNNENEQGILRCIE